MHGRTGRVTGAIGPGLVGEVMVAVRGGVEAFYAYPYVPGDQMAVGDTVLVMEYDPPRSVRVAPTS
ncbi:hypothetical protein [Solicola sp. PLA-1-18]|uniref:hypothetical protein n=1 Tax=Solicola sp. PLA-1-18 TaxID=3380532 RepID=UPI003B7772AA